MVFLLGACSYKSMVTHPAQPGDYYCPMEYKTGSYKRSYRLHIPPGYEPERPMPLVISLHGAFSSAKQMERRTGLNRIADRENFLVLYPNGIGRFGFLQHWNAGHCCGKAFKDGIDDVGFISAAVEHISERVNVDCGRIYLIGYSNGGMMAHRLAAEKSSDFAAVAVVAGTISSRADDRSPWRRISSPQVPVPILIIHGQKDDYIPYEGGKATGRKSTHTFYSVKETTDFWVRNNNCMDFDEIFYFNRLIRKRIWFDESGKPMVVQYALSGWGHDWPGPSNYKSDSPLTGFDCAEVIWEFFRLYHK